MNNPTARLLPAYTRLTVRAWSVAVTNSRVFLVVKDYSGDFGKCLINNISKPSLLFLTSEIDVGSGPIAMEVYTLCISRTLKFLENELSGAAFIRIYQTLLVNKRPSFLSFDAKKIASWKLLPAWPFI